jgi:hypothetical protein
MISFSLNQIVEKEWPTIKQAPWIFCVCVAGLSTAISVGVYELFFKEIVSHQQATITVLRDELNKKHPTDSPPIRPTSTATQTASPGGVNAAGSDVKVGDIGCPPQTDKK